ncbi:MAG: hypothetical protein ABI680_04395 [Chthoniobacteraceae bacterium]
MPGSPAMLTFSPLTKFAFGFWHLPFIKTAVDIPEIDLKNIRRFSGEKKKAPAIVKLVTDALRLKRRSLKTRCARRVGEPLSPGRSRLHSERQQDTFFP